MECLLGGISRGVCMVVGSDVPVEVGKEYDVMIDAQGTKGDGIAHYEKFVIFVAGAHVGESCRVRITVVKRTFALAEKV